MEICLSCFCHLSPGGIIEACPPSDSVTALSVNILIEPDGATSVVSSGDQIHAECEFSVWGYSVPQCSVLPDVLNEVCLRIGDACRTRAIVGYFTVDFLTFFNPRTVSGALCSAFDCSCSKENIEYV